MERMDGPQLGRLFRRHAPALRLYARQWAKDAEDLVQEAFVRLAEQNPPPERVLPWLYSVVRNAGLARARSAARRRQRERRAGVAEAWFAPMDDGLDAAEATRLLAALPDDLREIIVARLWGGLTFEEVAEVAGCSLPTAHRRYQQGLALLREKLKWTAIRP